jgi:hypothetical protein
VGLLGRGDPRRHLVDARHFDFPRQHHPSGERTDGLPLRRSRPGGHRIQVLPPDNQRQGGRR